MNRIALVAMAVVLCACDKSPSKEQVARERDTSRAEAKAKAKVRIAKVLAEMRDPMVMQTEAGQLVVLDVPEVVSSMGRVDTRRCYVWRDTEFKTAVLSCASEFSHPPVDEE